MASFIVVTDSTSDLGADLRRTHEIEYLPMNYVLDDVEYPASLDWESHSCREFYDFMRNGKRIYTTQVPRDTYYHAFSRWLSQGLDVVYVACSSALSGSVNVARVVAEELKEQYPEQSVFCIDSLISSLGQGYLCLAADRLRREGKTAAEVAAYITENRLTVNQFGTVESLEFLRQAGRVTASSAFFGNLFGVKPIIISDCIGQNFAVKKVKGALNAKREIAAMMAQAVVAPETQTLYISHADAPEEAARLQAEIQNVVNFADCYINPIGPIVGASVGPGTIIAFCVGNTVTVKGGN